MNFPVTKTLVSLTNTNPTPTKTPKSQLPNMPNRSLLRRILLRSPPSSSAELGGDRLFISAFQNCRSYATAETFHEDREKRGKKWFTLPPFTDTINGAALGKELSCNRSNVGRDEHTKATTALKWVTRCCPEIPRSLVQKLFRLRQVGAHIQLS